MARDVDGLDTVLADGFSRYLLVDIMHGTNIIERGAYVDGWSLTGDLSRDPKTSGTLRIVHPSVNGESWVPQGASGLLSPFQASLLLTEVISVGSFERRIQLGLFDVVAVPAAQDFVATVGSRWVEDIEIVDDDFPDVFPADDIFPGGVEYGGGRLVGGTEVVVASIVTVDVESLDGRVLGAAFRNPRAALQSAQDEWRAIGLLPVGGLGADAVLAPVTWPAEAGSRLDAVQLCARTLGGVPVVDSAGQWTLVGPDSPTVELVLGEHGTVVDLSSSLTLDDFANVIIGDYEDEAGNPIRVEWVAPGAMSPEVMGREIVRFHTSDQVRTIDQANDAVAAEGDKVTSQEVDVQVTCVYNPVLELGDHAIVDGADVDGVVQGITVSDAATMRVVVRTRRTL